MKCLTKTDLPKARSMAPVPVPLPHLGDDVGVYVRRVSGNEVDAFEAAHIALGSKSDRLKNFRGRVIALCACDESGTPIYTPEEADLAGDTDSKTAEAIYNAGRLENGIFLSDEEKEGLEKNLQNGVHAGSPTE